MVMSRFYNPRYFNPTQNTVQKHLVCYNACPQPTVYPRDHMDKDQGHMVVVQSYCLNRGEAQQVSMDQPEKRPVPNAE